MNQNESQTHGQIRLNRRSFLTRTGVAAAGTIAAVGFAQNASAARRWCNMDPVVLIDGKLADIFLASDIKLMLTATGPSVIKIGLPSGSKGSVILSDLGFGLKGYDISFHTDSSLESTRNHTQVAISAYVPSSESGLPLKVTFAPRTLRSGLKQILFGTSSEGLVNEWVYLNI